MMKNAKKKLASPNHTAISLEKGIIWFLRGVFGLTIVWVLIGIIAGLPYKTIVLPTLYVMLGISYLMLAVVLAFCVYGIKLLVFALFKKFSVMLLGLNLVAWTAFSMLLIVLFDDYERSKRTGPIYPLNITGGHTGEVLFILFRVLAGAVLVVLLGLAMDYIAKQRKRNN